MSRRWPKAHGSASRRPTLTTWVLRLGLAIILAVGWFLAAGPGGVSPLILPAFPDVFRELGEILADPTTWQDARVTAIEILIAIAISMLAGFAIGGWIARTPRRTRIFEPILFWNYVIPHVLFYPLLVLWVGVDMWSKVAYSAWIGVVPMAIATAGGFRAVAHSQIRLGIAFGASRSQIDRQIKLRAALPMVASGMRITVSTCVVTVLVAEMLASTHGLGFELKRNISLYNSAGAMALMLILLTLVGLINFGVSAALRMINHGADLQGRQL